MEKYRKLIHPTTASDILSIITRHHRLQGSNGLWDAVKDLKEILDGYGIPSKIYRIEPGASKPHLTVPISWDPLEASLEIKINGKTIGELSLDDHPTLLSAHSPGGEGCAELEICSEEKCGGEAVLATGYLYDVYMRTDARLIIYYTRNRDPGHVPYTGLFLKPGDPEKAVVMNIPYSLATRIISKKIENPAAKIEVCWKARVHRHGAGIPILVSCTGDDPGIVYISHICHPKPGAHDNASGLVANMLIAMALSEGKGHSHCNIWVPEYTGTVFLWDKLPWIPRGVINLDMVGSKQWITGSTLTLVNPPRLIAWRLTPILWLSLYTVLNQSASFPGFSTTAVKWSISPYGMGSDHDVFTLWGYEAPMLNEWPSKYYHTDGDKPDTISSENLVRTALAALVAGEQYMLVGDKEIEEATRNYESHVRSIYYAEARKTGYPLTRLQKNLVKKPIITEPPEKPLVEGIMTGRKIYEVLGREKYLQLRKIRGAIDALSVYLPLAEKLWYRKALEAYTAERMLRWTRKERKQVLDAWETIRNIIKM